MSIILKGIDLPKTNEIRMVAINSNGKVFFNTVKDGIPDKTKISQAIQIPKGHGRLIDANKYLYYGDLVDEPTILEAEEIDEFDIERD